MTSDPWEHSNLAGSMPHAVERLQSLLASKIDMQAADQEAKAFDKYMFEKFFYHPEGGEGGCVKAMSTVYPGFNATVDGPTVAAWLGKPCE